MSPYDWRSPSFFPKQMLPCYPDLYETAQYDHWGENSTISRWSDGQPEWKLFVSRKSDTKSSGSKKSSRQSILNIGSFSYIRNKDYICWLITFIIIFFSFLMLQLFFLELQSSFPQLGLFSPLLGSAFPSRHHQWDYLAYYLFLKIKIYNYTLSCDIHIYVTRSKMFCILKIYFVSWTD